MHDLRSADTEDDLKDFEAARLLRHPRIKAGPALLDKRKVKSCCEGDRLDVITRIVRVVTTKIGIVSWNGRVQSSGQTRDRVRERRAEIGIGRAAVARPPARIHGELGQICQPPDLLRSGGLTTRKCSERVKIDTFLAFGMQIGVEKVNVA